MGENRKRFTLSEASGFVDVDEFKKANADTFTADDVAEIDALAIGESISYGGGAAPLVVLTRVEDVVDREQQRDDWNDRCEKEDLPYVEPLDLRGSDW